MTQNELRAAILRAVAAIARGEVPEDDAVELKGAWPADDATFARLLAAQANAARGHEFAWIIGVDEKRGVVGAEARDPAEWLPRLRPTFDGGILPRLTHLNVEIDQKNVVGLAWEPDDPPYVLRQKGERVTREVPWREGTSVRSADRTDLLRLLEPAMLVPSIERVAGFLSYLAGRLTDDRLSIEWHLQASYRVTPRGRDPLVIGRASFGVRLKFASGDELKFTPHVVNRPGAPHPLVSHTSDEVVFQGAGTIQLLSPQIKSPLMNRPERIEIEASALAIGAPRAAVHTSTWVEQLDRMNGWWGYWLPEAGSPE